MKNCSRCGSTKPLTEFTRNSAAPDGHYSICRPCKAVWAKAARQRPEAKEREAKRLKAAYDARREELLARRAARYAANKEAALAKNREWRERNLEQHRELCRRWARENPLATRAITAKRRALKNSAEGMYTEADIERMLVGQSGLCACCGEQLRMFHVDHIVPISKGGTNWPDNLQLLCPPCNISKGDKLPDEFANYRIRRQGAAVAAQ